MQRLRMKINFYMFNKLRRNQSKEKENQRKSTHLFKLAISSFMVFNLMTEEWKE